MNIFVPMAEDCKLVTDCSSTLEPFIKNNLHRNGMSFVKLPEDADIIIIFEAWSYKTRKYAKILELL